jgi:hypothetical protein
VILLHVLRAHEFVDEAIGRVQVEVEGLVGRLAFVCLEQVLFLQALLVGAEELDDVTQAVQ